MSEDALGRAEAWVAYQKQRYPAITERDEHAFDNEPVAPLWEDGYDRGYAAGALGAEAKAAALRKTVKDLFDAEQVWRSTKQPDWVLSWQRTHYFQAFDRLRALAALE